MRGADGPTLARSPVGETGMGGETMHHDSLVKYRLAWRCHVSWHANIIKDGEAWGPPC